MMSDESKLHLVPPSLQQIREQTDNRLSSQSRSTESDENDPTEIKGGGGVGALVLLSFLQPFYSVFLT